MGKKGFIEEFKEFISRGNVMDMAVGVIIGGAFQSIITSMVKDVIMPIVSLITGGVDFTQWSLKMGSEKSAPVIHYGNLITSIMNFLLMALVIFAFIKVMNNLSVKVMKKTQEEVVPTTKKCAYCLSEIPVEATKCAHCTSEV